MCIICAANHGTVMELGITPIVTSVMIMQLIVGYKIIEADNSGEDRALLNGANKLLGIMIVIGEVVAYVMSGMYGVWANLERGMLFSLYFRDNSFWKAFSPTTINSGCGVEFGGSPIAIR